MCAWEPNTPLVSPYRPRPLSHHRRSFAMNSLLSQELCSLFLCQSLFRVHSLPISATSCHSFLLYSLSLFDCARFPIDWDFASLCIKRPIIFTLLLPSSLLIPFSVSLIPSNSHSIAVARTTSSQQNKLDIITCLMACDYLYDPKKMEIRFTLSQSVTFTHTQHWLVAAIFSKCSASNRKRKVQCDPEITKMSWTQKWKKKLSSILDSWDTDWIAIVLAAHAIAMSTLKRRCLLSVTSFSLLKCYRYLLSLKCYFDIRQVSMLSKRFKRCSLWAEQMLSVNVSKKKVDNSKLWFQKSSSIWE